MAEYIKADTNVPVETITPANGRVFTLQELQKCVGGDVETITLTPDLTMYVNEEGIRLHKPLNSRATAKLWKLRPGWSGTPILGDVLIVSQAEAGANEDDEDEDE